MTVNNLLWFLGWRGRRETFFLSYVSFFPLLPSNQSVRAAHFPSCMGALFEGPSVEGQKDVAKEVES